jgi:hypothetical protein
MQGTYIIIKILVGYQNLLKRFLTLNMGMNIALLKLPVQTAANMEYKLLEMKLLHCIQKQIDV